MQAVIFQLIGDFPAMRKEAGFSGPSATLGSCFKLPLNEIKSVDKKKSPPRTNERTIQAVTKWEDVELIFAGIFRKLF